MSSRAVEQRPKISKGLLRFFGKYSDSYLRRHFHSVRLLANGAPKDCVGLPLIVFSNHSSWWDPLIYLLLARRFFPGRNAYGPIDANALQRYRFFRRLGFFGVALGSARGAADFLKQAGAILAIDDSAIWLTPQGKFADDRVRPPKFQNGLAHLARRAQRAAFLPVAVEYTYWEERLPEILISFGEPIVFEATRPLGVPEITRLFESALASVQDQLAAASQRRQSGEWRTLLSGRVGTSRVYDLWRNLSAKLRGESFGAAHSDL